MNPYIFKRKDEPIAIINLTEDGSIVNYKLNSKYERYICGIKQKRIVALVISLQKRQSFYYFRLLINFIIKCYGIFLAHGIKCVCWLLYTSILTPVRKLRHTLRKNPFTLEKIKVICTCPDNTLVYTGRKSIVLIHLQMVS